MFPTKIGSLHLENFIYNAAGVWDTTTDQCNDLNNQKHCAAVITKTCTIRPQAGNKYPKYHFTDQYSINSNGLENNGLDYYIDLYKPNSKPLFISIGGTSDKERITMINMVVERLGNAVAIELNLSCPNLGCPGAAYDPQTLQQALDKLFSNVNVSDITFGLKLPPYYLLRDFEAISTILSHYHNQIDFITCVNSIPNGLDFDVDNGLPVISPNDGYGGLGGPSILPVGLSNVRHFSKLFKENCIDIDIVGCGGISSGSDVYKYLLAGAKAVQIGSQLWKEGPMVFERVSKEFHLVVSRKGIT